MREFDLNIEKILDNWSVADAVREIIANAIDEQILTKTKEIEIYKEEGIWHIRDYGRGISIENFTQNENEEKIKHPNLIGKFGVGLKDALATFNRHELEIKIISAKGIYKIKQIPKAGFEDIITLHVIMNQQLNSKFVGTDFQIENCKDEDINNAKKMFLKFNNENVIEKTIYGEILEKNYNDTGVIYINGVRVATEANFLFSYNITSLNSQIKKSLNRERTNVGRSAYADRIKNILIAAKKREVLDNLTRNLGEYSSGNIKDELQWNDVNIHAIKQLNLSTNSVFVTAEEYKNTTEQQREIIKNSGKNIVFIPTKIKERISNEYDYEGTSINTVETIIKDYNESFEYEFIPFNKLTLQEKKVFNITQDILELMNAKEFKGKIEISETINTNVLGEITLGLYSYAMDKIIIRRSTLTSIETYAGVLIHELIHATKHYDDLTRTFEMELTNIIGVLYSKINNLNKKGLLNKIFK